METPFAVLMTAEETSEEPVGGQRLRGGIVQYDNSNGDHCYH